LSSLNNNWKLFAVVKTMNLFAKITAIQSSVDFVGYKLLSHLIYFYWLSFSNIFAVRSIPTLFKTWKHTHIPYINRVIRIKQ
jgi:hypothetical protein